MPATHAEHIYRLRWEVETFYKVNKSGLGLGELTSSKPHIVRIMIMAALLRSSLSMMAKRKAEAELPRERWINPFAWTQHWILYMSKVVEQFLFGRRPSQTQTWRHLAMLTMDPELRRPPTRFWITNTSFCDFAVLGRDRA